MAIDSIIASSQENDSVYDKIKLTINGVDINNIRSYIITKNIFEACTSFEFDIDPFIEPDINIHSQIQVVDISVNDRIYVRGWIDSKSLSYNKQGRILKIKGRDMMSSWVDNHIIYPHTHRGSIVDIINEVISGKGEIPGNDTIREINGQAVSYSTNLQEAFFFGPTDSAKEILDRLGSLDKIRKIDSQYGNTIYEFVSNLVNPYGLTLYYSSSERVVYLDTLLTDYFYVDFINSIKKGVFSGFNIINTNQYSNVLSCEFSEDITKYYKYIRVVGKTDQEYDVATYDLATGLIKKQHGFYFYDNLAVGMYGLSKSYAHETKLYESSYTTDKVNGILEGVSRTIRKDQLRDAYSLKYILKGHSQNGIAFDINVPFVINDDILGFSKTLMRSYKVELKGSRDGIETTVYLCPSDDVEQFQGGSDTPTQTVKFIKSPSNSNTIDPILLNIAKQKENLPKDSLQNAKNDKELKKSKYNSDSNVQVNKGNVIPGNPSTR